MAGTGEALPEGSGARMFFGPPHTAEPTAAELEIIARNDREVGTAVAEAYVRWREEYGEKRRRALEAFGLEPERELFG